MIEIGPNLHNVLLSIVWVSPAVIAILKLLPPYRGDDND